MKFNPSVITLFLLLAGNVWAQQDPVAAARKLALAGERKEAEAMLTKRLAEAPGDTDARTLYGTVLLWDADYPAARRELEQVLQQSTNNGDAMQALASVELDTDHPQRAEDLLVVLMRERPSDPDVLYAHARALLALKRNSEADKVLERLLDLDPGNKDAVKLRKGLGNEVLTGEVAIEQYYERFSDRIGDRAETQVSIKQSTSVGGVIARMSNAQSFGLTSNQMDFDFYPGIRKGTYAYLNLGFSPDHNLYPEYRVGADIFQTLGHNFEGTVGYRRLGFSADKVNIYTTALSRYQGNWLFTGRGYFTPDIGGTSESFQLIARRFFPDGITWIQFRFSHGSTPTEIVSVNDIAILNATGYDASIRRMLGRHWMADAEFSWSREDRIGHSQVNHYFGNLGIIYRF